MSGMPSPSITTSLGLCSGSWMKAGSTSPMAASTKLMETENKWRIHMENEINDLKYELASLSYLKEEVKALKTLVLENKLHPMLRLKDRQVLEYIFSDSKQSDLIVVFGDNYLQHSNFRYLGPEAWVESSVITMISLFLTEEEMRKSGGCSTIWYLPCRLLIYIPILSSSHYCLARVIISLKKVEVWDSLADEKSQVRQSNKFKEILRNIDLAMANQIKKRPLIFSFASLFIHRAQNVPRQLNFFDCGVFVALFMIHRCRFDKRSFEA
ncbi:hypothetical protein G4B88_001541 [Cannabis sativa]|uniref:Ubiquitin-like protease family profile domain-containing protein n=1 Tax=Cannabis sativa TaxID=3483 RepID=A0A7J6FMU1_CANSA|nr:hypothetical protein G4B88_001541 [Cannabis sativa]